jgi:hypothetical protein
LQGVGGRVVFSASMAGFSGARARMKRSNNWELLLQKSGTVGRCAADV